MTLQLAKRYVVHRDNLHADQPILVAHVNKTYVIEWSEYERLRGTLDRMANYAGLEWRQFYDGSLSG